MILERDRAWWKQRRRRSRRRRIEALLNYERDRLSRGEGEGEELY